MPCDQKGLGVSFLSSILTAGRSNARKGRMLRLFLPLLLAASSILYGYSAAPRTASDTGACFIENRGQWPEEVRFLARTPGMQTWVTNSAIVYDLYRIGPPSAVPSSEAAAPGKTGIEVSAIREGHSIRMQLGGRAAEISPGQKLDEYHNYLYGNDPDQWYAGVPLYAELRHRDLQPGIDTRLYFEQGRVRYDYVLKPFADPHSIRLRFDGVDRIAIDRSGELLLSTSLGELRHRGLYAYQRIGDAEHPVECAFRLLPDGGVGFEIGTYSQAHDLVIDPLIYSTILGGTGSDDANDIVADRFENAYITGLTSSDDFPTTVGAYKRELKGANTDVFVAKYNPGGVRIFSTYIGDTEGEEGLGIEVDANFNIAVTGWTNSPLFPATIGAYNFTHSGNRDAFVLMLDQSGGSIIYSTFIGSSDWEEGRDLAIDLNGNTYITGFALTRFFPATAGAYDVSHNGREDAFAAKLSADGSSLLFSTFLGGDDFDIGISIDVDAAGNVYVGGKTESSSFPTTVGAYDRSYNEGGDAFVVKLNASGSALQYATFVGGELEETFGGMDLDDVGNVFFCGTTFSNDFPFSANAYDRFYKGLGDAYVAKLNRDGDDLDYATFLGGGQADAAHDVAVDREGKAHVFGITSTLLFPLRGGPCDEKLSGEQDLFVTKFTPDGDDIVYSTYIGGDGPNEFSRSIDLDRRGQMYLTGRTQNDDFPVTDNTGDRGGLDVFVSKLNCNSTTLDLDAGPDHTICFGNPVRIGNFASGGAGGFSYKWTPPDGLSDPEAPRPLANPASDIEYAVTVTDERGCRAEDVVSIKVLPQILLDVGDDIEVCAGEEIQLGGEPTAQGGSGQLSYLWTPSFGLDDPTIANPVVTQASLLGQDYRLTVTDERGCSSTAVVRVLANDVPFADAGRPTIVCLGVPFPLGGAPTAIGGSGEYEYEWTPEIGLDDPKSANPVALIEDLRVTTLTYRVEITDSKGCVTSHQVRVTLNSFTLDLTPSQTVCPGEELQIEVVVGDTELNDDDFEYAWSPRVGLRGASTSHPTFERSEAGIYDYTVFVTDPSGCTIRGSIRLTVPESPRLSIQPSRLDFGKLGECGSFKEETLIIRNSGREDQEISISASDGFSLISPASPFSLRAGQEQEVRIQFQPTRQGKLNGELLLTIGRCGFQERIILEGEKTEALAALSTETVDFGTSLVCDAASIARGFYLKNIGRETITARRPIILEGPFANLTAFPRVVNPGDSVELLMQFTPSAAGNFSTEVLVPFRSQNCDDTLRLVLRGRRLTPELRASLAAINFEQLTGCEQQRSTSMTISNPSDVDISLEGLGPTPPFRLRPAAPLLIASGASVEVEIVFEPAGEGNFDDLLQLRYEPCGRDIAIAVRGSKQGVSFSAPDVLDLGELVFCSSASKTLSFTLRNTGSADADGVISDVAVSGLFTTDVSIGDQLPSDGSGRTYNVRFVPEPDSPTGNFEGKIELLFSPCDVRKEIRLLARKTEADLGLSRESAVLESSVMSAGQTRRIVFYNTGSSKLAIEEIDFDIPGDFTIVGIEASDISDLSPGDSVVVTVRYEGNDFDTSATLRVRSVQPCIGVQATTIVRGEGREPDIIGRVTVVAGVVRPNTGERFSLPVWIEGAVDLIESGATGFEVFLSYNKTIMLPTDAARLGSIVGERRHVQIQGSLPLDGSTLGLLDFEALLGNDSCTEVTIDSVAWLGGQVESATRNGEVCLENLCRAGNHTRLYQGGAGIALRIPSEGGPVRSSLEVDYTTAEDGDLQLQIVDMNGKSIHKVLFRNRRRGNYRATITLAGIPSGVYMLVLSSETQRADRILQILD